MSVDVYCCVALKCIGIASIPDKVTLQYVLYLQFVAVCAKRYRNRTGLSYHYTHSHLAEEDRAGERSTVASRSPSAQQTDRHKRKKSNCSTSNKHQPLLLSNKPSLSVTCYLCVCLLRYKCCVSCPVFCGVKSPFPQTFLVCFNIVTGPTKGPGGTSIPNNYCNKCQGSNKKMGKAGSPYSACRCTGEFVLSNVSHKHSTKFLAE